jgi:hypothetical protein
MFAFRIRGLLQSTGQRVASHESPFTNDSLGTHWFWRMISRASNGPRKIGVKPSLRGFNLRKDHIAGYVYAAFA